MLRSSNRMLLVVLAIGCLSTVAAGALGGVVAADALIEETDGEVITLDHPDTVSPDGEFNVTVKTNNSAGTVVEVVPDEFNVTLASDEAVAIEENRVEFLDPDAGMSTYTVTVTVVGGETAETAEITAWVNAADRPAADDESTSTITVEEPTSEIVALDHPDTVAPNGTFNITVETANSAGTVVEVAPDEFNVTLASDEAVAIEENRVEFLDPDTDNSTYTIEADVDGGTNNEAANITAWIDAEDRASAADTLNSTVMIDESLVHPPLFNISIVETNSPLTASDVFELTAAVENTGDRYGEQDIELRVNGSVRDTTSIAIDGNNNDTVTLEWPTAADAAGTYTAEVMSNNDSDSIEFTIQPDADPPDPPAGGGGGIPNIRVVTADLESATIDAGNSIVVTAVVRNDGSSVGEETIQLTIDGTVVAEETYTLSPRDEPITTEFTHVIEDPGEYEVAVGDELLGTVTVQDPTSEEGSDPEASPDESDEPPSNDTVGDDDDSPDDGDEPTARDSVPGFGFIVAVVALLTTTLLYLRKY